MFKTGYASKKRNKPAIENTLDISVYSLIIYMNKKITTKTDFENQKETAEIRSCHEWKSTCKIIKLLIDY